MNGREALSRVVQELTRSQSLYRFFPSSVERQHEDGTVDVLPDDEAIRGRGYSRVPVCYGIPGVTARVPSGARVLLFFLGGDASKPTVSLWPDKSQVDEVVIGGDAGSPCARQGDTVEVSLLPQVVSGTFLLVTPASVPGVLPPPTLNAVASAAITSLIPDTSGVVTAGSGTVQVAS